ncbi:hypothetical protein [Emticicia sp. SJ17W-69]|uniref:hypothetical protein n=1 Tax=Emticicia sp. SJ17W-69 TaxID=3421657 RepID=UPI003EB7D4E2
MKKSILVFVLLILALVGKVSAQHGAGKVSTHDFSVRFQEGINTVQVPNGTGTVRFLYRGGQVQNANFQDATGKIYKLGLGGPTGDPTAQVPGCESNCDNCKGGCHKICIEGYCCYGCTGNTISAGANSTETTKPSRLEIIIHKQN